MKFLIRNTLPILCLWLSSCTRQNSLVETVEESPLDTVVVDIGDNQRAVRDCTLYFPSSKLVEWHLQLEDTTLHGWCVRFYKNENVRDSIQFFKGIKSGLQKSFKLNGEHYRSVKFVDGCKQWECFYGNGALYQKSLYSENRLYMNVLYNGSSVDTGYVDGQGPNACDDQLFLSALD